MTVIIRDNTIEVEEFSEEDILSVEDDVNVYKRALYFDLEHYVYKHPICIGVFGCAYYDEETNSLKVIQYMLESKKEIKDILIMAVKYFTYAKEVLQKDYIVTFSGNNDFFVINYLLEKYNLKFDFKSSFKDLDLQKAFEKKTKENIGLKALEKKIGIEREGELISGSTLAKTFAKVVKDKDYINRMPEEKIEKILLYNEQDVVNLFHILTRWNTMVHETKEQEKE
ncbi:MAG: ribonuclease H-like domain-containing protein [Clostridium sp.]|uniref:ribonuclease H-like domain-containing protein n=1 Tax=Clostridium sp. TaxID=1506 RepID=UPI002A8E60E9|nr:ribonuclease H-like domain-containing protein [Clostridium sp.]MDY5097821.1 ribonuclease H-like domain-containing protein [Clostridium sp.]